MLKVEHHVSNASSSKEVVDEINPRYLDISVCKNNRYRHLNKEVLDNLKNRNLQFIGKIKIMDVLFIMNIIILFTYNKIGTLIY